LPSLIIRSKFGEALPDHCPKQFLPIVDLFVVVIQGEKIAVGANEGNLIFCPSELDSGKSVNRCSFAKISASIKSALWWRR